MSTKYQDYDDDDGRIVADMSDVERQPMLIPQLSQRRKNRSDLADIPEDTAPSGQDTVSLDADERRAMIGGAVSAGLLVVGVIAAAFAALILLILKVWG